MAVQRFALGGFWLGWGFGLGLAHLLEKECRLVFMRIAGKDAAFADAETLDLPARDTQNSRHSPMSLPTASRAATAFLVIATTAFAAEPRSVSGIYPHLAMFNAEGECGTGAVVPWADRLWVITYGPHLPKGSSDKLYEITPALEQIVRPESIGGTPANRMIHRESAQLFIGPYAIDAERNVRAIPYATMFGAKCSTATFPPASPSASRYRSHTLTAMMSTWRPASLT